MKNFLFIILVVVAAVLLWAIRTNAYADGLVFSLGLVAAALSGHLISDYFSKLSKQSLTNNFRVVEKENQALRERADLLQTQFNTATPHAEVEQFEQRIALLDDEKSKLDGISRAQTGEIANLKEKIESLQKSHSKLLEDSTIATETANTQAIAIQDELAISKLKIQTLTEENTALREHNTGLVAELDAKNTNSDSAAPNSDAPNTEAVANQDAITMANLKIKELTDENTALREHNSALVEELDTKNTKGDPDTEGVIEKIVSEKTDNEQQPVEAEISDNHPSVEDRSFLITELAPEETAETEDETAHYGSSDNLQAVEGIGPKVDTVLKGAGIGTWEKLSMATPEHLRVVLDIAGKQYRAIDPTSWPEQARLLVHREFSKLKKYKDYIG